MKMKNLLIGGMSLALVACISIGGTLAYLQAKDGTLTNTFTFAGNITVDVFEDTTEKSNVEVTSNGGVGVNVNGGIKYTNLVPGQPLSKNVDVKLTSSVKTDLYVLIDKGVPSDSAKSMNLDPTQLTENGWTQVSITDANKLLYKMTNIENAAEGQTYNVFESVTAPAADLSGNTTVKLNDITIKVFAVQSDNLDAGVTADSEAAKAFEVTLTPSAG